MMIKLISGALVGTSNYNDIYDDDKYDDENDDGDDNHEDTTDGQNVTDHLISNIKQGIPTMQKIANKIAKLEKTKLDEKQYIAYEMIACTFLLGLVRDAQDSNTALFHSLHMTIGNQSSNETIELIKRLKARGGKEQLLMFLTGPAGSGKSTAMRVAEQFCYEFCAACGVMWCDKTFLFTAYTGSAASLIGGLTISKAAHINQKRILNSDDINEWRDVKILVIDEVSFMSDNVLKALNNKLMEIGNRTSPFGGLSIIFAGDFRQLEPVCSKESDLMFSTLSSMFWKRTINAILILDNGHRFKKDEEYGQMLKRMWEGDLTIEDRKRINTRVIGHNGLALPSILQGEYQQQIIQFWNNLTFQTMFKSYLLSVLYVLR